MLDANALDKRGGPEDAVVDELLALAEGMKLSLVLPHSVRAEINHPNTPADVKRRAARLLFSTSVDLTGPEFELHRKVRTILQGNAKPGKHDRDAYHLVEAAKYGGHFITSDKDRPLKKRDEVAQILPHLQIVTPAEFLAIYRQFEAEYPE